MDGTQQILAAIAKSNSDFSEKLADLKTSMEEMETRINKNMYDTVNKKFDSLQQEVDQIRIEKTEQDKKIENIERQLRKRNILLFGVSEEEKAYNELEKLVLGILMGQMEIECSKTDIQFAKRLGPKFDNKPRPILITLTTMGKKIEILQNKNKLKDTPCYIKEDFPKNVLEKRKELQNEVTKYREEGIKAIIRYDKIIILSKNNKRTLPSSPNETKQEASQRSTKQTPPVKSPTYEQASKKNKNTSYSPKIQKSITTFTHNLQPRINTGRYESLPNSTKETGANKTKTNKN